MVRCASKATNALARSLVRRWTKPPKVLQVSVPMPIECSTDTGQLFDDNLAWGGVKRGSTIVEEVYNRAFFFTRDNSISLMSFWQAVVVKQDRQKPFVARAGEPAWLRGKLLVEWRAARRVIEKA